MSHFISQRIILVCGIGVLLIGSIYFYLFNLLQDEDKIIDIQQEGQVGKNVEPVNKGEPVIEAEGIRNVVSNATSKFYYFGHIDPQNQVDAHSGMAQPGDKVKFIWKGCDSQDADISIELENYGSETGEKSFEQAKNPGDITIAESIPNSGEFDWIVPKILMIGSDSIHGVFIPRIRSQACDSSLNDKYTVEIQPL